MSNPSDCRQKRRMLLVFVFFSLVTFFPALTNGFVIDDFSQIVMNKQVHSLENIPKMMKVSTFGNSGNDQVTGSYYRPVMMIVYTLIYNIIGPQAAGFHWVQIILHGVNGWLLYCLLQQFKLNRFSLELALIFVVHPLVSESVVYVAHLQEVMCLFFGLTGLLVLMSKWRQRYKLAAFLWLLSLLSKETGVVFGLVGFWLEFQRTKNGLMRKDSLKLQVVVRTLIKWPLTKWFGMVAIVYGLLRLSAVGLTIGGGYGHVPINQASLINKMLTLPAAAGYYLKMLVIPCPMVYGHQWIVTSVWDANFWWYGMFTGGAVLAVIKYFRLAVARKFFEISIACFVWLGLNLAVILLLPRTFTVADHWFYLALVPIVILVSITLSEISKSKMRVVRMAVWGLVVVLAGLSNNRSRDWRDIYTLTSHDIAYARDSYVIQASLGAELVERGELEKGIQLLEESVDKVSCWPLSLVNLSRAYGIKDQQNGGEGWLEKAIVTAEKSIVCGGGHEAYLAMAELLVRKPLSEKSKIFYQTATSLYPQSGRLWYFMAQHWFNSGEVDQARVAINRALAVEESDEMRSLLLRLGK